MSPTDPMTPPIWKHNKNGTYQIGDFGDPQLSGQVWAARFVGQSGRVYPWCAWVGGSFHEGWCYTMRDAKKQVEKRLIP